MKRPEVGELRLCLVCAHEKPWGIFHEPSGVCVCVDCRDARAALAAATAREADAEADVIHRWGPAVKPYRTIAEFVAFEQECRKVREESDAAHTERVVRWCYENRPGASIGNWFEKGQLTTESVEQYTARALAAAKGGA